MSRRPPLLGIAAVAALALAGCTDSGPSLTPPPAETRIDVDTPALREAKAAADVEDCPSGASAEGGSRSDLPDLRLRCLGGGDDVRLADLAGPAVVNVWASWCGPCKEELPLFGRLHREAGDRLSVIGVNYEDTQPDAALELLGSSRATYPQLADPAGELADQVRVRGLPGTLFVTADGAVTFRNQAYDSWDELSAAVAEGTGVDPRGR